MSVKFRVGLSRDFIPPGGKSPFTDIGLDLLDADPNIEYEFLKEHLPVTTAEQLKDYDGFIALGGKYTQKTFEGLERLTIFARHGVGYDNVDVKACTEADVMLTITPAGIRRSVAEGILTFMLTLSKHLIVKDKLVREGRWYDRQFYMGINLEGKTLGSVGLGNIASELFRLAKSFGMRFLAHDPYVAQSHAESLGVTLVDLNTLMRESDYVSVNCPLSEATRGLISAKELALMKPTAYFINTARGPIVDQKALTEVLREKRIRGAALDVLEVEPVQPNDPLLELDNVILTPHAIGWTEDGFRHVGAINCRRMIQVSKGGIPDDIVNKEVLERPGLQRKLARYKELRG